ncbi:Rne/Rng family ribonuclease [Litorivicinus sp.]|nr:Rne/Rng family ribonuclease [Litorivicinus sp.]
MRHEILLSSTPQETRAAVVEQGLIQEIFIERATHRSVVGNVYLGKVVRVLPGLQACFVDIGMDLSGFLHAKNLPSCRSSRDRPINRLITEGQQILVQVIKGQIGAKGVRLTAEISLPARHLVLMPFSRHVGVSKQIDDPEVRECLKVMVQDALSRLKMDLGVIVRAAGQEHSQVDFEEDLAYLKCVWETILAAQNMTRAPSLLFEDLSLIQRMVRDQVNQDTERVLVDTKEAFALLSEFAEKYMPDVAQVITYYTGAEPLFDFYGVNEELDKALDRTVELNSGAYLVIEQTEAMVTIDVNTGRFVGTDMREKTVFKTNLEAAVAIGRQLRVRNLTGVVVIDFIDMDDPEHRRQIFRTIEQILKNDPVKTRLMEFNEAGLLVLTRKRARDRLSDLLQESCSSCGGIGKVKTTETICYEIFRAILREARGYSAETTTVIASPSVFERLVNKESKALIDLEHSIHRTIRLQVDQSFPQDRFEVILS